MSAIMVPLDGSPFAEQALPLALAIGRSKCSRVQLVTVRPAPFPGGEDHDRNEAYVRVLAARVEGEHPGLITPWVLAGRAGPMYAPQSSSDVAELLVRHARDHEIELIVMTTHGRSGVERAWLGSVADSVIRTSTRPVLLVRPGDGTPASAADTDDVGHVLITLDGSKTAEYAISMARRYATADTRFTLLRVVPPLAQQLSARGRDLYWAAYESPSSRRAADDYLQQVAGTLREAGIVVETAVVESTSPAAVITDYADEHAVDMIALTTAGAGGMKRLFLGSVADKVVRSARVPVLVCNARRIGTDQIAKSAVAPARKADPARLVHQ
ncbi:MAG: universal stress protein [Gemmatimonadetes bacterium]|nr:universal stress protein [Gemmatimonadota bacterium]